MSLQFITSSDVCNHEPTDYICNTISDVPHGALGPELTDDPKERNNLYFWYNVFRAIGIILAAVGPVGLASTLKGGCDCLTETHCEEFSESGIFNASELGSNYL